MNSKIWIVAKRGIPDARAKEIFYSGDTAHPHLHSLVFCADRIYYERRKQIRSTRADS